MRSRAIYTGASVRESFNGWGSSGLSSKYAVSHVVAKLRFMYRLIDWTLPKRFLS